MESYNCIKDVQSCGATIQNILLTAHSLGVGSCWIGEIIDKNADVKKILRINDGNLELMAIVTLGYCDGEAPNVGRKSKSEFLI